MALRNALDIFREVFTSRVLFQILRRRFHESKIDESDTEFQARNLNLATKDHVEEVTTSGLQRRRNYLNLPLVLGVVLVAALLILTFGGHRLTPNSPYTTRGLKIEEGEFLVPPFEPSDKFMWGTDVLGRDIASLIIAGAWQTMRLAATVVVLRLFLGFLLGAIAGWKSDTWIDRLISGLAETVFAFPPLLFAMILVLALGIRKGLMPFVVALTCVGWGEVMQYVRGEVMAMRSKTFIESAVSVGRRVSGIITHHVLPNLIPSLIPIAALEMGAVLMLLGELGYVGVFIGGGAFAELVVDAAPYHYSDVPEWGALLSNVRLFALTYPWTAFYPAMVFFVTIAGFNLFGEGIRRLISDEGVRIHRILNRYTLMISVLVLSGLTWMRGATGSISIYARQAEAFSGFNTMENLQVLTSPEFEGRAIGTDGLDAASNWIASEFEALGLQPAGKTLTYFQPRRRDYQALDQVPVLEIGNFGPTPVYQQDFSVFPSNFRNLGSAKGLVRFVALGDLMTGPYGNRHPTLEDLDYSREIVMVLSSLDEALLNEVDCSGVLVVANDPLDLQRNYTLSPRDPHIRPYGSDQLLGHDTPVIWITEDLANRIIIGTGQTVADLREVKEDLEKDEVFELQTHQVVAMEVDGSVYEKVTINQVIGHWPGEAGYVSDQKMDHRLIVVLAKYDNPPVPFTGEIYQGANDNASGVAIMLEMIRAMKETGYEPNRTILFVAYSGEGAEGGIPAMRPPVSQLLQSKAGFASFLEPEAVVELRGLGAGDGAGLALVGGGSLRLTNLFEDVARRVGVETERMGGDVDLSVIYRTGSSRESAEETPIILLTWDEWEATSQLPVDQLDTISIDKLKQAGEVATLAVMIMGRELDY
ncbi:MAG: ABC transporter permease subunit [Anaerolineales bacterium]